MAVPKAAVNEQHHTAAGERQIGATGKVAPVKTETITGSMKHSSYRKLRRGIAVLDRAHDTAS